MCVCVCERARTRMRIEGKPFIYYFTCGNYIWRTSFFSIAYIYDILEDEIFPSPGLELHHSLGSGLEQDTVTTVLATDGVSSGK